MARKCKIKVTLTNYTVVSMANSNNHKGLGSTKFLHGDTALVSLANRVNPNAYNIHITHLSLYSIFVQRSTVSDCGQNQCFPCILKNCTHFSINLLYFTSFFWLSYLQIVSVLPSMFCCRCFFINVFHQCFAFEDWFYAFDVWLMFQQ